MTHDLKTWPVYFEAVWTGAKTYEVRLDDRGYQRGDQVVLREWDRAADCTCLSRGHGETTCERYSGRTVTATIGFVTASTPPRGSQRGFVGNGYVVFSLVDPVKRDGRAAAGPSPADVARVAVRWPGE